MTDPLLEQAVIDLQQSLRELNENYKERFHFKLITVLDLDDECCEKCKIELEKRCMKCVVGYEHIK